MGHDLSEPDQLRALHDDPKLWALMERWYAARTPVDRQAALAVFVETADGLYPDWRRTVTEAEDDGRIPRAMTIHLVKRIRERVARGELDEFERVEAREAEAKYVVSFDEFMASSNPAAAFRMQMAFWELTRLAKLDPEEMEELRRRAVRDSALKAGKTAKEETARSAHAKELTRAIATENPGSLNVEIVEEIPKRWRLEEAACFTTDWLKTLVGRWRRDGVIPPPTHPRRRRTYPERKRRYRRS